MIHDCQISCERFDGDDSVSERAKSLRHFKETSNCKVLLISVVAGGVGLNIVEANHIGFLDRWYHVRHILKVSFLSFY